MATSSVSFSGLSSFASDFQTVIQRAVNIASLPITQLNATKSHLADQVSEYTILDSDLSTLRTALSQLQSAITGSASYTVSTSDGTVLSASASDGARAGSYKVAVTQLGAYAQYMSTSALQGTIPAGAYTLSIDTGTGTPTDYSINISGTGMSDLVDAINASGAPVQASMVNMGTSAAPVYRLSLQSTQMAPVTMTLTQGGGGDLLQQVGAPGQAMQYQINDDPTVLSSNSPTIDLSTGLKVTLLNVGSSTITVSRSTAPLGAALNSLATAYNAVMTELAKNHGQSGGALTGQSQVMMLENSLRQLMNFQSSEGAGSLAALGLAFDKTGSASFDPSALNHLTFSDIQSFLGDATAGFLQNANTLLDEMDGASSGVITDAVESLKNQISKTNDQIDAQQQRVDLLQASLMDQMAKADSAIYAMEQQANYFKNLFDAMRQDSKNITG
jgi:flagellar hook-associated protein 2